MSTDSRPGEGVNTNMRRPSSPDLRGVTPGEELTTGDSDSRKRKLGDSKDGEAHREAGSFYAKRPKMQDSAQPDHKRANNPQKNLTKGQGVDEMDIDSSNKGDELDLKL